MMYCIIYTYIMYMSCCVTNSSFAIQIQCRLYNKILKQSLLYNNYYDDSNDGEIIIAGYNTKWHVYLNTAVYNIHNQGQLSH